MTKELPLALQYGMSTQEYWHEDKQLLSAYEKAYYNNVHYVAWVNGLYIENVVDVTLYNVFKKKGETPKQYFNKPIDVFEIYEKNHATKQQTHNDYQQLLSNQNDFIKNIIENK